MRLFAVVSLLVVLAGPAAAQAPEIPAGFSRVVLAPAPLRAPAVSLARVIQDSTSIPKTHWLEGALFGAAAIGLLFGEAAAGFCADTDSGGGHNCGLKTVEGFFLGAGLGFTIGGLIGGMVPKR